MAFLGLMGIALVLFVPRMSWVLDSDVSVVLIPVYLLAYLFAIIALPLMLFALLKFVYSVFIRPYLRLWRLRRFQNNKYLREAVRRRP